MNNLKYYNDALAYDFKMFETTAKKEANKDNIVKMPEERRKSNAKRKAYSSMLFSKFSSIVLVLMVLAMICSNIYLRSQISETTAKISAVKKEIVALDSEETRLNVEYEKIISYNNLEAQAAELGMKKKDKSQVVYIRVNDTDAAKTSDGILIEAE